MPVGFGTRSDPCRSLYQPLPRQKSSPYVATRRANLLLQTHQIAFKPPPEAFPNRFSLPEGAHCLARAIGVNFHFHHFAFNRLHMYVRDDFTLLRQPFIRVWNAIVKQTWSHYFRFSLRFFPGLSFWAVIRKMSKMQKTLTGGVRTQKNRGSFNGAFFEIRPPSGWKIDFWGVRKKIEFLIPAFVWDRLPR